MSFKIALAQMALSFGAPEKNRVKASEWVNSAAGQGSEIILLPELWSSGYDLKNCQGHSAILHEGDFALMRKMAEKYKIAVGGSLIERDGENFFNTFSLYNQKGEPVTNYRKIHLFQMLSEEEYFQSGTELVMVDSEWGKIGLATCYDLRFPEMFRSYAVKGVELFLVVAEWAQRRVGHWSQLLLARAVENQCFIAAVNKAGVSQGEVLGGYSAVISPMGKYLAQGNTEEELLVAEINLKEVQKTRRWMPVFQDRKPDLYEDFNNRN